MRRIGRFLRAFYSKAFDDNLTGLAAMVAYNLVLSILPLALLGLFIAGRVLESGEFEESIVRDLRNLFPGATEGTVNSTLDTIERSSTRIGIAALVASIWIGSSFWGALDTAFCRIYHVDCRSWLQQKRFAVLMLVVVLLFMAATVSVPTLQSILYQGAEQLPFGLESVRGVVFGLSLLAGLLLLFMILCVIYWTVPNLRVPWRGIWPGSLAATLAIGLIDFAFPFYLSNISTIERVSTTLLFILIVLIWFYLVAIIILGGAEVNAMRFEHSEDREADHEAATPAPGVGLKPPVP